MYLVFRKFVKGFVNDNATPTQLQYCCLNLNTRILKNIKRELKLDMPMWVISLMSTVSVNCAVDSDDNVVVVVIDGEDDDDNDDD